MGQTTDQIATDIHHTRRELKSNLQELETRVKSATDWRNQFRKRPVSMAVIAMIGGALLSSMLRKH